MRLGRCTIRRLQSDQNGVGGHFRSPLVNGGRGNLLCGKFKSCGLDAGFFEKMTQVRQHECVSFRGQLFPCFGIHAVFEEQ